MTQISSETAHVAAYYLMRLVQRLEGFTEIVDPIGVDPDRQVWERTFDEVRELVSLLRSEC